MQILPPFPRVLSSVHTSNGKIIDYFSIENHHFPGAILHHFPGAILHHFSGQFSIISALSTQIYIEIWMSELFKWISRTRARIQRGMAFRSPSVGKYIIWNAKYIIWTHHFKHEIHRMKYRVHHLKFKMLTWPVTSPPKPPPFDQISSFLAQIPSLLGAKSIIFIEHADL